MPRNGDQGRKNPTGNFGKSGGSGQGSGMGRGNRGGGAGLGPVGECTCPDCGATVPHQPGFPCAQMKCPKCGAFMIRKP